VQIPHSKTTGDRTNLAVGRIGKNTFRKTRKSQQCFFQNGLAFLGRIGKASLTEFPEIYAPLQPLVTLLYDVNVSKEKINIFLGFLVCKP
jgi:hypothetical protein